MTAAVIAASILLALWPVGYVGAAARWPGIVPVPRFIAAWLEELPPPPRLRAHHVDLPRPEGPAPATPRPGAGLLTRILARLMPATGCHAKPIELVFDPLAGRLRDPETGPMTAIPQRYLDYAGKAAEGWWAS